jgi:hypothetical protein
MGTYSSSSTELMRTACDNLTDRAQHRLRGETDRDVLLKTNVFAKQEDTMLEVVRVPAFVL